jgi:hypothetical protein
VRQVVYLQEIYLDAWATEHKIPELEIKKNKKFV